MGEWFRSKHGMVLVMVKECRLIRSVESNPGSKRPLVFAGSHAP